MKNPLKYRPSVNQVELSYWNPQPNLLAVCVISLSTKTTFHDASFTVGQVARGTIGGLITIRRHVESQGDIGVIGCAHQYDSPPINSSSHAFSLQKQRACSTSLPHKLCFRGLGRGVCLFYRRAYALTESRKTSEVCNRA